MNQIYLALFFAAISPVLWGLMNVIDKFIVSRKAKNPLSFAAVAGLVNLIFGLIIALFLSWNFSPEAFIFPAIAGILLGSQFFFYYYLLKKEDASNLIGLIYIYPIFVAILSFLFLSEVISLLSYIGTATILVGALSLTLRMKKIKLKVNLWLIGIMVLVVALNEFFIKLATNSMSAFNGLSINLIFMGLTVSLALFSKRIRLNFYQDIKKIHWAFLSETLTLLGTLTIYLAMVKLPATVVSSVAAIQPLAVLFFERIAQKKFGNMTRDESLKHKLIPIILIILGVILLYIPEILKL